MESTQITNVTDSDLASVKDEEQGIAKTFRPFLGWRAGSRYPGDEEQSRFGPYTEHAWRRKFVF